MREIVIQRKIKKENLNPIQLKKRQFNCDNVLKNDKGKKVKVCQSFVLKLLQVPRSTLFRAVTSAKSNPSAIDKRGKYPAKRANARYREFIRNFLSQIPVYESKASNTKFLHPSVQIKHLYSKYKEKSCEVPELKKVLSLSFFTKIFKKEFNFKRFKFQTKQCSKCMKFDAGLKAQVISTNKRSEFTEKKEKHLEKVRSSLRSFFDVIEVSQCQSEKVVVLSFKLGVPIDLPSMNLIFDVTKRRLWLHNFCIFDETLQKKIRIHLA